MNTTANPIPPVWTAWQEGVRVLCESIDSYLFRSRPPAVPADICEVRKALDNCAIDAHAVGDDGRREIISFTLAGVHQDVVSLANRLIAQPPYPSAKAWMDAGALPPAHDWFPLRCEVEALAKRLLDPNIKRELVRAARADPTPPQRLHCVESDRSIWFGDKRLACEVDEQIFELISLLNASYPNAISFPEMVKNSKYLDGAHQGRLKKKLQRYGRLDPLVDQTPGRGWCLKLSDLSG